MIHIVLLRGCRWSHSTTYPRTLAMLLLGLFATACIQCNRAGEHASDAESVSTDHTTDRSNFNQDGVADLGYTEPGSTHELLYVLHAPTDTALTGIGVESDCPCVQALEAPARIEAGEQAAVRLRFKAPEKVLRYRQDLLVYATGSGERVESWLTIDARLGLPLRAVPEELRCQAGVATTIPVELRNEGHEPVKLIYALSDDPSVKVAVPQAALAPGDIATLRVTVAEGWAASGPVTLRVKTTSEAQPEVLIRVYLVTP